MNIISNSSQANNIIPEIITTNLDKTFSRPNSPDEVGKTPYMKVCQSALNCGGRNIKEDEFKNVPTWPQNLRHYCLQYCEATTIHGVRYIGERGRLIIEKIVWTITVIALCISCIILIVKTYQKWVRSPVIVTFATTETGIWEIPFPAVTICPEAKSDPEVFNYTEVMFKKLLRMNLSELENQYFDTFSLVCTDIFKDVTNDYPAGPNFTTTERTIIDLLTVIPSFDPLNLTKVRWLGEELNWYDILSVTVTKEGFCYTFNMLNYDEIHKDSEKGYISQSSLPNSKRRKWSLEDGYPSDSKEDSYPRRTFLSGMNGGLIVEGLYANDSHLDYACNEGLQGFKVMLHHPSELPDVNKHFRVPLDQAVIVAIKPRMTYVREELRWYKPEERKCYFSYERPLAYFKSYSQQNCLDECLSNYTLSECKCLAFYMAGFNDSETCGPGKNECLERSKVNYLSNQTNNCNCLPFCTALVYDVEITQSNWYWYELFAFFSRLGLDESYLHYDYKKVHFSKLAVFYKDLQFLASERHELYGYTDFFSNVGGLLGLFIGFSLTSLIEIVYFLSLRIVCNIKKFGKKWWSGELELIHVEEKRY